MEESIKNRIILILICLSAILLITTISSCSRAGRFRTNHNKEMITRMDLEEKISKGAQDKANIEEQLKKSAQELEDEKAAHQATQKELGQAQLVNRSLTEELEKMTKLKEAIEEDLKEALVEQKSAAKVKPR